MRTLLNLIFIIMLSGSLWAFDWEANKITVENKTSDDSKTELQLKDDKGFSFKVTYSGDLSDKNGQLILKLKEDFSGWKNMKLAKLNFIASEGIVEAIVVPSEFSYEGTAINDYVPAGMIFSYTDYLQYNFRITVNKLFVRIKGDFKGEDLFCKKLVEAIKNPQLFIKKRDPEYFLEKIEELETSLKKLNDEKEKIRNAVITLHNSGFFSGPSPIPAANVQKVLDMKKANPKWNAKQISEELEKQKVKISDKEVGLILAVFLNEFEK